MKKKILFVIPNLKQGGAEKVLVNLVNNLNPAKYNIKIFSLFNEGIYIKKLLPHISYDYWKNKSFRGNSILIKCFSPKLWWKMLINEKYDIVISYLEGPTTRIVSGCLDPTIKKIAWIHSELTFSDLAKIGFKCKKEALKAYQEFDRVVAVSKRIKERFVFDTLIDDNTIVLYNTNETEEIKEKSKMPVKNSRFLCDDVFSICAVARLVKVKGIDRLLEVHVKLLEAGYKHRVYVLGDGEERVNLENRINSLGVKKSFVILGYQENPYSYMAQCDLCVCPSLREGFSTVVTEALIIGIPVVSTDCSGAKELLGDNNEYGMVVHNSIEGLYQGVKTMMDNPQLLSDYRCRALIKGDHFCKNNTVKAVEEMLDLL